MTDVTGDFMRKLKGYQHGDFFIAVYEINSRDGANCFYGWDSETGSYIGCCGPHPDYYDAASPTTFSLCLGSSPGDVIFRFDDPDGEWLFALAAKLSEQMARLEKKADRGEERHMNQSKDKYNGWSNSQTWTVNLWITNDQSSYFGRRNRAKELLGDPSTKEDSRSALATLADEMRDAIEEACLIPRAGLASDLMNGALREVDWHEIAQALIDEASDTTQGASTE